MSTNEDFRQKFYENYYERQASRSGDANVRTKAAADGHFFRREVLPNLPADRTCKILELGCGYGSMLQFLDGQGYKDVTGVDVSADQAAAASKLGVEVVVADVFEYLQQIETKYDVIVAFDLIEHFDKPVLVELLELINSRLNPGGTVIFRTPNIDAPMGTTYAYGDFTHGVILNAHSAVQLMLATGSKMVDVQESHIHVGGFKEVIRSIVWAMLKIQMRLWLFATGKSTKGVVLTPNLIIVAKV